MLKKGILRGIYKYKNYLCVVNCIITNTMHRKRLCGVI